MRWPHGKEWSQHLVRYTGGHSSLDPVPDLRGPHGGYVNARGYEHVTCLTCGQVTIWPPQPVDAHCAPPGHDLVYDADGRVVGDVCPQDPLGGSSG